MHKILFILSSILVLTACNSETEAESINKVVSVDQFKKLLNQDDIQLIDVRTPEEYSVGKIDDALNINIYDDNFQEELKKLDPNKTTLVYCAKGGRSAKAAQMMKDLEFKEVYDLEGGYSAWK